ncbi:MAG: metal-dependent hydrolase [Nanoarchaeota archaeon]
MLIRTHISITIFALLLVLHFYSFSSEVSLIVFFVFAIFSTMLPDIDTSKSRIGKFVFLRPLQYFAGHRKGFHSLFFVLVAGLLISIFSELVAWAFVLGYGLHILADCFTITGISLFYPFSRVFRGPFKSGGKSDLIVFFLFLILDFILVF